MLVDASPKFQLQEFTVPGAAVEASVNAIVGQAEELLVKFAVQETIQLIVTDWQIVSAQLLVVPMIRQTV